MRLVFMGSPDFSVPILAALLDAGHEVRCVYVQPPRPAGRGQKERSCPVQVFAAEFGLDVHTPRSLKGEDEQRRLKALRADAAVVAAYGLILPRGALVAPRLGCFNVHASLLPRWRGAAPIQRALLAGDTRTGVTIMKMDAGLDTGPTLLSEATPIGPRTTAQSLHDLLASIGARLMVRALDGVADGSLKPVAQPAQGVTYAVKLDKNEGRLDWTLPATELERRVRALNPWPGVWFEHDGQRIKVLAAEVVAGSGDPGTVLDDRLTVACGTGALRPTRLQRAGKADADAAAVLRGYPVAVGVRLSDRARRAGQRTPIFSE